MSNKMPEKKPTSWMVICLVTMIGGFMAILNSSIINVAIPTLMNHFGVSTSKIQWVITGYMLAMGVVVPVSGWLGDRLGHRLLYLLSLVVFTIGSVFCTLAWNENALIAARVIQALGGGMLMPTIMTIIYLTVPQEKIGSAMGIFGLTMIVAPAIGPTLGGYLLQHLDWHWIFTISLPVGIVGIFLALLVLPELPHKPPGKLDVWGALLSSLGVFCLLLVLSQGSDWGWTSFKTVSVLYLSFALLGLFTYHQLTTDEPLLDLRVFRHASFTIGNLMLVIINVAMFGGIFYITLFLQTIKGLTALEAGLIMLPPALVTAFILPVSGWLYDQIGPKPLVSTGVMLLAYSTYLFTNLSIDTPNSTIILWNSIRSFGMGLTMMPIQTALMTPIPPQEVGRASAITNIISRISGSFGLAALTSLFNHRLAFHTAYMSWFVSGDSLNNLQLNGALNKQLLISLLQVNVAKLSFVQSFRDIFLITAFVILLAFFPAFLLEKGKKKNKNPAVLTSK